MRNCRVAARGAVLALAFGLAAAPAQAQWVEVPGRGQVEPGGRLPLAGKNLIAGPEWVVGYFTPFSM